jgi:hypothetical protein
VIDLAFLQVRHLKVKRAFDNITLTHDHVTAAIKIIVDPVSHFEWVEEFLSTDRNTCRAAFPELPRVLRPAVLSHPSATVIGAGLTAILQHQPSLFTGQNFVRFLVASQYV